MNMAAQHILGAATAAGLIFGGLAISEARADEALWKTTQYWNITGDFKGWCRAQATYGDDFVLNIALNGEGWKLMIASKTAIPMEVGKLYTVDVALVGKSHATLTGVAYDAKGLGISNLTPQFVKDFAFAPALLVANFGKFNLKGSAEAIIETHACFKAVTGADAKASSYQGEPI